MKLQIFIDEIHPTASQVWNFAKARTSLFLGLCTAGISVVTILLNTCEYCYKLGYYYIGNNVPMSLLEEPRTTGISGTIILSITITCFFVLYTLMSQNAYREHRYRRFLLSTTTIISLFFGLFMLVDLFYNFSWDNAFSLLLQYITIIVLLTISLNVYTILYCVSPSNKDIVARKKIELNRMDAKIKNLKSKNKKYKLKKKYSTLNKKIKELEDKEALAQSKITNNIKRQARAMVFYITMSFCIILFLLILYGLFQASYNKEYTTIINQEEICAEIAKELPEEYDANMLVVMYQNKNTIVAAPCYVSEKTIKIYKSYQRILSTEGMLFHNNTYLKVE